MPTAHQFGQEIDGNARRGPNICPVDCIKIITKHGLGVLVPELAEEFGQSKSAIKYTIRTYANAATTNKKPCSGRPSMLSLYQKNIIYRKAHAAPKAEYSELAKAGTFTYPDGTTSKPPSRTTLWRVLKRRGLTNYRCKKRPKLTTKHAQERQRLVKHWKGVTRGCEQ
jgi:transposase